jgi:hypothetical protein
MTFSWGGPFRRPSRGWLEWLSYGTLSYRPQPYEQLAALYRRTGRARNRPQRTGGGLRLTELKSDKSVRTVTLSQSRAARPCLTSVTDTSEGCHPTCGIACLTDVDGLASCPAAKDSGACGGCAWS